MAKYIFLQYVDESRTPRPGTPEMEVEVEAYGKLFHDVEAAGILRGGDPCQPSAAGFTVQVRDGKTVATDGPMHSGSPWLNGYWVFDCKDRADAIAWAARIPAAEGGSVEVHPIFEM